MRIDLRPDGHQSLEVYACSCTKPEQVDWLIEALQVQRRLLWGDNAMIPQEHATFFVGGKLVLYLDNAPEPEMLPTLIEPMMRAVKEIGDALDSQGRDVEDEKGDHAEGQEGVERNR